MSNKTQKLSIGEIIFALANGLVLMYGIFVTTPKEGTPLLEVIAWGCLCVSAFVGWSYLNKRGSTNE